MARRWSPGYLPRIHDLGSILVTAQTPQGLFSWRRRHNWVSRTRRRRGLTTVAEARDYLDEAMRLGRPAPWREVWHRFKSLASDDEAIEAIGDLRELLEEEDLVLPDGG